MSAAKLATSDAVGLRRQAANLLRSPSARRPAVVFIVGNTCTLHLGALQHGDVAAVLDLLRLEAGVGREAILELEALHVGHLDDLHREDRRAHAVGLHEVVERRVDVEEQPLVGAALGARQRQRLELAVRRAARHQVGVFGVEPEQRGRDGLIGPLGHRRVPGRHLDASSAPPPRPAADQEHRAERLADERRAGSTTASATTATAARPAP